ncbi:hypothetical protein [Crocinitomix algicola]|uniref:hypothetical protein n=1 Tax=Crocinitomix algicola TaxID=1740263 RepID=UPI000872FEA9|nr:hypothetical protein [Crocinitomix algicola]
MNKRIITTYSKLNPNLKKAIKEKYPNGVEDNLTVMKNVFKGYLFDGLVFDHEDITYMIEWNAGDYHKQIVVNEEDDDNDNNYDDFDGLDDVGSDEKLDDEDYD